MVDAVRTEPGLAAGQLGPPGKAIEAGSLQGWDWAGVQSAPPPKIGLDPKLAPASWRLWSARSCRLIRSC